MDRTYDRCFWAAKKYSTVADFKYYEASLYAKALKEGWMEDFDWLEQGQKGRHKNTSKHFRGYWTFDKCHEESLKYGTASEFQRGNSSAYQAAVKNHWIEKLF